jgi:hypothetical protein
MSSFFYLDGECSNVCITEDGPDICIYIPGPPGPAGPGAAIIDLGTRASPEMISESIPAQTIQRQRIFIEGASGPALDPVLTNGSGTYELILFCTSSTNTVTLNGASNLQLSGQWVGLSGSMICLIWDGSSQYVEAYRNEI